MILNILAGLGFGPVSLYNSIGVFAVAIRAGPCLYPLLAAGRTDAAALFLTAPIKIKTPLAYSG